MNNFLSWIIKILSIFIVSDWFVDLWSGFPDVISPNLNLDFVCSSSATCVVLSPFFILSQRSYGSSYSVKFTGELGTMK